MSTITAIAEAFFTACETGKGWEGCSAYCTPNATFAAQAEPLLDVKTLERYTGWMKGLMTVLPDARYEVKSFATDAVRNNVAAYGVFHATHTGEGGPVPPTGRSTTTERFNPAFVAPAGRIAAFDNDGTLCVEQPLYVVILFAAGEMKALAPRRPEWKDNADFQKVIEGGPMPSSFNSNLATNLSSDSPSIPV